jgi:oligopeptide transport system permease protein
MFSSRKPELSSILPIVCLAMTSIAGYMLWTRRYMVDELNKDYIRLAKLKGLSTRSVMYRHVLKNAFVPLVQYLPYSILLTVGGSLLVERFFSVPGMGPILTDAISRYDINIVQGIVILYASLGIIGVFLGDILMTLIDPRIRLTSKGETR